jgi:chaperonin GroES
MLQPIGANILIRPHLAPDQTASGLHLIEHWVPENTGTVVQLPPQSLVVCPDCGVRVSKPCSVAIGDTVVFPSEAGQELRVDGERFLLITEHDLLAVLDEVPHG